MVELSIIIPIKNEEGNITALSNKIREAMGNLSYEVIWVNDGSTDNSNSSIIENADERTILVELNGNFGQSAAMQAGLHQASAGVVAFLDGDGQNDPFDLPQMYEMLVRGNWDIVAGYRSKRKDGLLKRIPSVVANWLTGKLTKTKIKDLGCTIRVVRKNWVMSVPLTDGMHRFINLVLLKKGAKFTQLNVNHLPRVFGKSKYGLGRIIPVARDLYKISRYTNAGTPPYTVKHYEIARCWKPNKATPVLDKAI